MTAIDDALLEMDRAAQRLAETQVEIVANSYIRHRDLPKLLRGGWEDLSTKEILDRLNSAYQAERAAVRNNHWSRSGMGPYRCQSLLGAIKAEERTLAVAQASKTGALVANELSRIIGIAERDI